MEALQEENTLLRKKLHLLKTQHEALVQVDDEEFTRMSGELLKQQQLSQQLYKYMQARDAAIAQLEQELKQASSQLDEMKQQAKLREQELQHVWSELKHLKPCATQANSLQHELNQAEAQLQQLRQDEFRLKSSYSTCTEQLDAARTAQQEAEKQAAQAQAQVNLLQQQLKGIQAECVMHQQRAAQVGTTDNMQQGRSETQQPQYGATPWLQGRVTGNCMLPQQPPEQYGVLVQQHNRLQGQHSQLLQLHHSLQEKHRALTGELQEQLAHQKAQLTAVRREKTALEKQRGQQVAVEVHPRVVKLKSRILALEGGLQSQQEVIAILRSQLRAHGVPEPAETTDVTRAGKRARAADDNNDSSGHAFKRQSTQAMMGAAADAGPAAACDTAAAAAENTGLAAAPAGDRGWDASAQKGNAEQVSGAAHQCVEGTPVADSGACSSDMAISASTRPPVYSHVGEVPSASPPAAAHSTLGNTHIGEVASASVSPFVEAQPKGGNQVHSVLQQLRAVEKVLAVSKGNPVVHDALEVLATAPAFSTSNTQLSQKLCKDDNKKKNYRKNGRINMLTAQLLETGLVVEVEVGVRMLGKEKGLHLDTRTLLAMFNSLAPGQDLTGDSAVKGVHDTAQPCSGVIARNAATPTGKRLTARSPASRNKPAPSPAATNQALAGPAHVLPGRHVPPPTAVRLPGHYHLHPQQSLHMRPAGFAPWSHQPYAAYGGPWQGMPSARY